MKISHKGILFFAFLSVFLIPGFASAHQPRINTSVETTVVDPEISKAYYGTLTGEPHIYHITSDKPFALYVNILAPDIAGQKTDLTVSIMKDENTIAMLDGNKFEWKKFFEPFGHDTYLQGPEYKAPVEAGSYDIRVSSAKNDDKYSLAVGEIEAFDRQEGMNALKVIPVIKRSFFDKSPMDFILSPMGFGYVAIMYLVAFIFGFVFRFIVKKYREKFPAKTFLFKSAKKNLGVWDRIIRIALGLILLFLAISSTWSALSLFISGFCIFEGVFSWCIFYQAIGRDTCPVE